MYSGKLTFAQVLVCVLILLPSLSLGAQNLPENQLQVITLLIDDGWLEDARDQLLTLVNQYPKDAFLRYELARACLWLGEYEQADKQSRKCIDLEDKNAEFQILRGHALGSYAQRGSKVKALSRAKGCRKAYEKAVKLEPGSVEARESLMMYHMMAPGIVGGKSKEARKQADAIGEIDPLHGYFASAQILQHLDDDSVGARDDYRAAIEEFTNDPEPCYEFAGFLTQQKEDTEAKRYFEMGIEKDSDPTQALMSMGSLQARKDRHEEAVEIFGRVLKIDPDNLVAKIGISKAYLKLNNFDQSRQVLTQILTADSDCVYALYQEGVLLWHQGKDLPKAEANIRRYLDSRLNMAWEKRSTALYHLAKVLEKRGDYNKAWEAVKNASKLSPYSQLLKDEVKKMEFMGSED